MIIFGSSHDMADADLILTDQNEDEFACSNNPGRCYDLPKHIRKDSNDAINFLAGVDLFKIEIIEAYEIVK